MALLAVALASVACGEPGAPTSPGAGGSSPDEPVASSPFDPDGTVSCVVGEPQGPDEVPCPDDGAAGPQEVEPQEGLVDVRTQGWNRAKVSNGGRRLTLIFWHGIEECYGVDRVEVAYDEDAITATLFTGNNPASEVCIDLAVKKSVAVDLEERVAGRPIQDGAPD